MAKYREITRESKGHDHLGVKAEQTMDSGKLQMPGLWHYPDNRAASPANMSAISASTSALACTKVWELPKCGMPD